MRKLFFLLAALFCLTGCSWFDSDPVNPKIIAHGFLAHDQERDLYVVDTGMEKIVVNSVVTEDHNPRSFSVTQTLRPVDGMAVTLFTSRRTNDVVCVMGHLDEQGIEELYHTNSTVIVILMFLLMICVISVAYFHPNPKGPKFKGVIDTNL